MKRKIISLCLASCMILGCLVGCGQSAEKQNSNASENEADMEKQNDSASESEADAEEQNDDASASEVNYLDKEPLRIANITKQMGVYLQYAEDNNLFEEAGINVEVYPFAGAVAINEAVGAGEIDGCVGGLGNVYALATNQLVLVSEVEIVGSDGIVIRADSDIASVKGEIDGKPDMYGSAETLKGKSFICQVGQAAQFYISKYVSQFGLTDDDINFVNMEVASAYQAFAAGEADSLAIGMPYIYDLSNGGDCVIAANVKDATDIEIKDPILFTPQCMEERPEEIKIFLRVVHGIVDDMAADPELRKQAMTDFYKTVGNDTTPEHLEYELQQNILLDSKKMAADDYYVGDGMYSVAEFYVTTGAIDEANLPNVLKNIDTSLTSEALGIEVKGFSK